MPDLSDIDSWPAAAVALVVLLSLQVPGLVSTIRTRRDTRVIRKQTENEHQDAEHPNLREQMDAMHADIREAKQASARAAKTSAKAAEVATSTRAALADHVEQADSWQTAIEDELAHRRRPLISWR